MRNKLCISFLSVLFATTFSFSQEFSKSDFIVSYIQLGSPVDSVAIHLGKAKKVKSLKGEGFTAHFYDHLTIWLNDADNEIWAFDISDSSFKTHRGLKVGDSVKKVEDLYGKRNWTVEKFERLGPYDYHFTNYSEATIYEYRPDEDSAWFIIFYIKQKKVVKILFYIGIED